MPPIPCANTPSAAKLFLQLCARRNTSSFAVPPSSSSILNILLPPRTRARTLYGSAVRGHALTMRAAPTANRSIANEDLRRQVIGSRRAFTTSRALAKTLAIHNPQKDDDGKDMLLEITPRAADRLSQIMSKDKNPYLALRIQVESGGCHGFQYLMSLTTLPSTLSSASQSATVPPLDPDQVAEDITPSTTTSNTPSPQALNEDDVIFSFASADEGPSLTSPKVVLDLPSLELLKGSKVDYTMELIGSQFKIVDNPLATSSCGCGTSFDIKV